ncbi:hypothetical protein JYT84_00795, partial [bacterium AH-315-M10]|nr:hypothetical protein [bacterium AH-315-M10]
CSSTMATQSTKRRQILVDNKVQRHYLIVWVVISASFTLTMATLTFVSIYFLSRSEINPYFLQNLSLIIKSNTVLTILITLFMGLYTVLLSHRIAGPSYRIRDTVRRVLWDKQTDARIKLRDHDYLQGVAEDVNRLLSQYENKDRDLQEMMEQLKRVTDQLVEVTNGNPELAGSSGALREEIHQLVNEMKQKQTLA